MICYNHHRRYLISTNFCYVFKAFTYKYPFFKMYPFSHVLREKKIKMPQINASSQNTTISNKEVFALSSHSSMKCVRVFVKSKKEK